MAKKKTAVQSTVIKDINEDTNQIKKFIIILFGVALVSILIYFVATKILTNNDSSNNENTEATITYTNVMIGNVFNRPYDEYYVFAYDPDSLQASLYASYLNNFDKEKGKIYFLDLSLEVNKKAVSDSSNKTAKNPNELKIKEPTLIKIKKGTIDKYLDSIEEIETELK